MSDLAYRPHKVRCDDGATRTARVRSYWDGRRWSFHADTYFSVPAYVQVRGRTVRGYVGSNESGLFFSATTYHKNHALIVKAPAPC